MEKINLSSILFVMQLPPPVHGASLMNNTIRKSILINQNFDCGYVNLATSKDMSRKGKKDFGKYLTTIKILYKTFYKAINKKYNLAYVTLSPFGIGFIKDSLIILLLKLFGIKIIIHLHGKGFKEYHKNSAFLLKKYEEFIFRDTYVIHLSSLLVDDVPQNIGIQKRFIVPNGIEVYDHNRLKVENKQEIEILYLSNLIEEKGLMIALEAISKSIKEYKNLKLKVIGNFRDKSFEKDCYRYIKLNKLDKFINFLGSKYNEDKYQEFISSDIFILPTYYKNEAFPLVILEAMQFGLPVISTFEGGIPDMVEDRKTGFLIEQRDVNALSACIEELYNNENLRENMGISGKNKFFNEFTIMSFENNLFNVFKEII